MSRDVTILSDENLQEIYTWVDAVPLTRAKRNITRDFSDGVLMAEVLHHYFPKTVDIKNYSAANSVRQKLYNWQTLNNKVRPAARAGARKNKGGGLSHLALRSAAALSSLPPPPPHSPPRPQHARP